VKLLGTDHPDVALTFHNLAALWAETGRTLKARALYRHALAIFKRTLGPDHPHVRTCQECYKQLCC